MDHLAGLQCYVGISSCKLEKEKKYPTEKVFSSLWLIPDCLLPHLPPEDLMVFCDASPPLPSHYPQLPETLH